MLRDRTAHGDVLVEDGLRQRLEAVLGLLQGHVVLPAQLGDLLALGPEFGLAPRLLGLQPGGLVARVLEPPLQVLQPAVQAGDLRLVLPGLPPEVRLAVLPQLPQRLLPRPQLRPQSPQPGRARQVRPPARDTRARQRSQHHRRHRSLPF